MNFSYSNKEVRLKIDFIKNKGYNILQLIEPMTGESMFFIVNDFEPPQTNSVVSSPFLTFRGTEVSEFLVNNIYNQSTTDLYTATLEQFMEKNQAALFKVSEKYAWMFFTK